MTDAPPRPASWTRGVLGSILEVATDEELDYLAAVLADRLTVEKTAESDWLTAAEAAEIAGCRREKIYKLTASGELPAVYGERWRVIRSTRRLPLINPRDLDAHIRGTSQ